MHNGLAKTAAMLGRLSAILMGAWLLAYLVLPLVLDGHIFSIESPVRVLEVTDSYVEFLVQRCAAVDLLVSSHKKLICDGEIRVLPDVSVQVPRGCAERMWAWAWPDGAYGSCRLEAAAYYQIFGVGLHVNWESESFLIP